jgi:hypothetical protein
MIFDKTLIFSDDQAITGTAVSTNVIDLGDPGTPYGGNKLKRDIGIGTRIPLFVHTTATFNNLTSLTVTLECCDLENFSSGVREVASRTYPLAELTAGRELSFPDALLEGTNRRYVRLKYTVTGTNPTTGKITAGVVAARQTNFGRHYA